MGSSIVPGLLASLHGERRSWVLEILKRLGPRAALAAPHLEDRADAAAALWSIDEARARALGLHVRADTRRAIDDLVVGRGVLEMRRHVVEQLESGDERVLGSGLMEMLIARRPDLVPADLVLAHAHLPHARAALSALRLDAPGALAEAIAEGAVVSYELLRWLGPLAGSDALNPGPGLAVLVAARRAAGLAIDEARVVAAVRDEPSPVGARVLAAQLPCVATLCALAPKLTGLLGARELHEVLAPFAYLDADARATVAAALPDTASTRLLVAELDHPPPRPTTVDGDALLLAGEIDARRPSAYATYADVLRAGPDRYAAVQLAWIDRGFGTPIEPRRIAWLRALGVRDEALLGELARPVPPVYVRAPFHFDDDDKRAEAERCEAAGLPSLAMGFWADLRSVEDTARCRRDCEAIIARLRAACL